jgi:hypothetical protein
MPRQKLQHQTKDTNKTKLKLEVMFCSDGTLHGAGVQTKINHVKGLVPTVLDAHHQQSGQSAIYVCMWREQSLFCLAA